MKYLLNVQNLNVFSEKTKHSIIKNISFELPKNSCLGILGESGSGKTMLCQAILGLLNHNFSVTGYAFFNGQNLLAMKEQELRKLRGSRCCMILQNPMLAFDPLTKVGRQMTETFHTHQVLSRTQAVDLSISSLKCMQLKDPVGILNKYPHQLSGGMLQRVMIAIAIALKPDLIIADEPTTALDTSTQYEVMEEFLKIRQKLQIAMIFISHDFGVISRIADNVLVMRQGEIIERGTKDQVFCFPEHSYTRYLISTRSSLMLKFNSILYNHINKEA